MCRRIPVELNRSGEYAPPLELEETMAPRLMLQLMQIMLALVQALMASRMELALENLALRQQVAALKRERPRPRLTDLDRLFWVALRDRWSDWANALIIVKPETVVRWYQAAFKRHWCHGPRYEIAVGGTHADRGRGTHADRGWGHPC